MVAFQPKVKKVLTRPTFKLVVDVPTFIRAEDAMFVGTVRKRRDGTAPDKEPPTLLNCTNLETGEQGQIILNTIVKQTLEEEYPSAAYVGKCFQITKQKRKEGKQYDPFNIVEIEDPAEGNEKSRVAPIGGTQHARR
jgi:hypothetical protein